MYAFEINSLAKEEKKSEIAVCFIPLMLLKDRNIVKTADIRRLISSRMKMWTDGHNEILIQEAENCDKKLPRVTNMTKQQEKRRSHHENYAKRDISTTNHK